jgi:hypothetical protein
MTTNLAKIRNKLNIWMTIARLMTEKHDTQNEEVQEDLGEVGEATLEQANKNQGLLNKRRKTCEN